jgi:hypothetical protein
MLRREKAAPIAPGQRLGERASLQRQRSLVAHEVAAISSLPRATTGRL